MMWAVNCNLDKLIIFSSFFLVFILCIFLIQEDSLTLPTISTDQEGDLVPNFLQADTNATELAEKIRILCLVMTHPMNHKKKAYQVYKTWGRRCTYVEFITTEADPDLGEDQVWVQDCL